MKAMLRKYLGVDSLEKKIGEHAAISKRVERQDKILEGLSKHLSDLMVQVDLFARETRKTKRRGYDASKRDVARARKDMMDSIEFSVMRIYNELIRPVLAESLRTGKLKDVVMKDEQGEK